jgi:ornithine carbamoyltransferase
MGQEEQAHARSAAFSGYTVDDELLDLAGPGAVAMHCLPAHRGQEITAAALDGPRSLALDQAENRLHVQKAFIVESIGV